MIDPKSAAAGNLAADRIDLKLIADMVARDSKVLILAAATARYWS